MKLKAALIILGVIVAGLVFLSLMIQPEIDKTRVQVTTEQVMHVVLQGVHDFKKKHGRLPGDINKDGIIGRSNFSDTLLPLPGETEDDEAQLFWKELALPLPVKGDIPYPQSALRDTYFLAGYLDGKPMSEGGATIKGNVIVWTGKFYTEGPRKGERLYPLRPEHAAYAERKLEFTEVNPKDGWVQSYGSPDCFAADGGYNLNNTGKSCGLIFIISD